MSTMLLGADKMQRELKAAVVDLADLSEPGRQAGRRVASAGTAEAPRRTGALAASHRSTADRTVALITANTVYAPVIHWGWRAHNIEPNPWLSRAAQRTEPAWIQFYEQQVDKALDRVRGLA